MVFVCRSFFRRFTTVGFALGLGLISRNGAAIPVSPPYEMGNWQGFRAAAISFTFDDNCSNQYAIAIPMFNAKDLKVTLFTVTSWTGGDYSKQQDAASYGHEIASHTVTHVSLGGVAATQQTNELNNSQIAINTYVPGNQCVTVAYPNCVLPSAGIAQTYYVAGRGCSGQIVPATPPDYFNISSFICGSQGTVNSFATFTNYANSATLNHGWVVYLIHGIDNDGGYSPLSSALLQSVVNFFSTNQNKLWIQTFGNVVRYARERNASAVYEIASTETNLTVQVTNSLSTAIYNYPITLRRPLPTNWLAAQVTQNGQPVAAQNLVVNSTNYIMFDVVPNAGDVLISKSVPAPVLSNPSGPNASNFNLQLNGNDGVTYAISSSSDLVSWAPIQTNTLNGTSTNLELPAASAQQFYRAQWVP